MMTFTELASVPSDPLAPFTDRLRLAVAAYLARFKGSSREHTDIQIAKAHPHMVRHTFVICTEVSRIASDASFGRSREYALPAAQRAALRRLWPAEAPRARDDLGLHGPPGSDATMLRLIPLRALHHRRVRWHHHASGSSRLHQVHHRRSRWAVPGPTRNGEGRAAACASPVTSHA